MQLNNLLILIKQYFPLKDVMVIANKNKATYGIIYIMIYYNVDNVTIKCYFTMKYINKSVYLYICETK